LPRRCHPPNPGRAFGFLFVLLGIISLSGCFGVSQNPSYFPHLLPTEDIIRTHAKPPGPSYYANFDPHAVRLEVRPVVATNPVRTQHVLIATVYDEKGQPRRNRRIEWMVEGVGNIVEVDESGIFPGRGYKVDNRYAVSYTNYHEHRITRGNLTPNDDFVVRPGQSWCVITSAVEGDTYVTVYAPEIADWDKHKVFVTNHWVDADWTFPPPQSGPSGTQPVFTTRVFKHTDRQPLANYRVRYRILDGPPAAFVPSGTQEIEVVTNLRGEANATLAQRAPALGTNRIGIEIIRPPDPTTTSAAGIVIGQGATAMEWLAPDVKLSLAAPPAVAVNQDIPYTITLTNAGRIESRGMTVHDTVPPNATYVSSEPPAIVEGNRLTWTLGMLPPGQSHTVNLVLRARAVGQVVNTAAVDTVEGQHAEQSATTEVTQPGLNLTFTGPGTGVIGAPLNYEVRVTNPGNGPATNVLLNAGYDEGLEHETGAKTLELRLGTLAPGETKNLPLILTARRAGRFVTRVVATADGGLRATGEHAVVVQQARLSVTMKGPRTRIKDRPAEWEITVTNPGDVALTNVVVRDQLPPELAFVSATEGGQQVNGDVEWRIGTLEPKAQKVVRVMTNTSKITKQAVNVAVATADPNLHEEARAGLEIYGVPAYSFQVRAVGDPVVDLNKTIKYEITVINTGSLPANNVEVRAQIPKEMELVSADGPSKESVAGKTVTFAAVNGVEPQKTLTYTIRVKAVKAGDVRFQGELRAETLQTPVIKQEQTSIYDTNAKNGAADK
jgi:uncharacterized repeat protein (TIGR01451 family)